MFIQHSVIWKLISGINSVLFLKKKKKIKPIFSPGLFFLFAFSNAFYFKWFLNQEEIQWYCGGVGREKEGGEIEREWGERRFTTSQI